MVFDLFWFVLLVVTCVARTCQTFILICLFPYRSILRMYFDDLMTYLSCEMLQMHFYSGLGFSLSLYPALCLCCLCQLTRLNCEQHQVILPEDSLSSSLG